MKKQSNWLIFTLVAIAQFMVVLDVAITNVALPSIKQQLNFNNSSLQWVVTAYALCFGGFLLLGGRAADLFGRRRMLLTGMIAFTLFSLLIGLSHTSTQLIILRALQGLSAAFMSPAALSIVLTTFKDGQERNKALGFWSLVATGGAAVGMLLGGALTQYVGWRWNFFINVPVGVVMALLIARFVPKHEMEEKVKKLDTLGAALITSSLMILVFIFSQVVNWGWLDLRTIGGILFALILVGLFIFNESRVSSPLMPLSIFRFKNVVGGNLIMAPIYAGMMGIFFITTLYIQGILHYSPVVTGLAYLPFPIILGIISTRMPKLVARFGYRRFLIAGPLLAAVAFLWLSQLPLNGNYFINILPALIIMPIGIGMTFMPTIAAATSGVPSHESGLASGLISTSQQMGGALGLSILSSVAASVTAVSIKTSSPALALLAGYKVTYTVGIVFTILAALVAVVIIRQPKEKASQEKSKPARLQLVE